MHEKASFFLLYISRLCSYGCLKLWSIFVQRLFLNQQRFEMHVNNFSYNSFFLSCITIIPLLKLWCLSLLFRTKCKKSISVSQATKKMPKKWKSYCKLSVENCFSKSPPISHRKHLLCFTAWGLGIHRSRIQTGLLFYTQKSREK